MDERRKYGEVKIEILNILSDNQVHSLDEINYKVNNNIGKKVSRKNLCTSLTQLIANGEEIYRVGVGEYCKNNNSIIEEKDYYTQIIEICKEWNKTLERDLSYTMSSGQFEKNRKLHEINVKYIKDLTKVIKS